MGWAASESIAMESYGTVWAFSPLAGDIAGFCRRLRVSGGKIQRSHRNPGWMIGKNIAQPGFHGSAPNIQHIGDNANDIHIYGGVNGLACHYILFSYPIPDKILPSPPNISLVRP
ncbi:hypothetical protein [Pseudogemmobacter bohemicus]|uniref:hypothetical protein n=1 Tax=Pseudogemmobacter bohemicus TaxID=2250708 RepID=UPI001300569C|nr:hypothetical protein [Pseudogemmobacter bohemicus]